jgi:hypothetical protein
MGSVLSVLGSILSVLITAGLGTWLAYVWQQRSARDTRYFDASKTQFNLMRDAARNLAAAVGKRLYATHRVCRISPQNAYYDEAKEEFRQSILQWNRDHLQFDLDIRTLFKDSSVVNFEHLQSKLAGLTNKINRRMETIDERSPPAYDLIRETEAIRGEYFQFLQKMIDEADSLFRQMHFGVLLNYTRSDIDRYSNLNLITTLFSGPDQESAVVRTPTDFGLPVRAADARLGIN